MVRLERLLDDTLRWIGISGMSGRTESAQF